MPGVKSVSWTESNRAKALDALLFYEKVNVSDETAEKIADHVGGGTTTRAIHSLFQVQKRKFKKDNDAVSPNTSNPKTVSRSSPSTPSKRVLTGRVSKSTPKSKSKKAGGVKIKDEIDSDADDELLRLATPPASSNESAAEVKRVSPRMSKKVDYGALDNGPAFTDDDGDVKDTSGDDSEFDSKKTVTSIDEGAEDMD